MLGKHLLEELGEDFYEFRAYDYGPFCVDIYRDADSLRVDGLIQPQEVFGRGWVEYEVTSAGAKAAEALIREAPQRAVDHLSAIVAWARRLSFPALVREVYRLFPEYRVNSVFQG